MAGRKRKCAAKGCNVSFVPLKKSQIYHERPCAVRDKQRRVRERAKLATQMLLERESRKHADFA